MSWTRFFDLQHGEWWLARKPANHFEFGVGEGCHHGNLNGNWTTSVLLSRDKHNCARHERDSVSATARDLNGLCSKTARRQIDGRITIPHPKQRFQSPRTTT